MMPLIEIQTTILGGLPVLVRGKVYPPEPDVGIFHRQGEVLSVHWLSGKEVTNAVYDRISQDDYERLQTELEEDA